MKRSLEHLMDFSVVTTDGTKGKIKDVLFDEDTWIVRYLEADFGNFFKDKRILIPGVKFMEPDWEKELFPINLTKNEIENSPSPEADQPVSKKIEQMLGKYYNYAYPWSYSVAPGTLGYYPVRPFNIPEKTVTEEEVDTNLRSVDEVTGYDIHALDGKIGHVEDLIIDDSDWQIVYVIADTGGILPWSKKGILSIHWLKKISYSRKEVFMDLYKETIENAPEFDSKYPFAADYEKALFEYYQKSNVDIR
jgi:sporulation protein YlmC with PRC-barrel domain